MRVMHILNDVTDRGNGIVNVAVDLAMEQARQGHAVAVASAGGGFQRLLESAGVLHFTLDQSRRPAKMLRAVMLFRRQAAAFQPDVVHAHMRTGLLLAKFWRHFMPYVLVGHVHNVHDRESLMMRLADGVIAVSHSVASTMAHRGIPKRKLRVVLNRTLNSLRQPRLDKIQPAGLRRPSVVTVCGMNQRKGVEELIAAFNEAGRKFPAAHLYLVGDGPERRRFEQLAETSALRARIHFEGFQAVPQAYMLSTDVFVLAARRESFGLVLIEARAAGCAIVATNADGIGEALDDGAAGILVEPRNASALAQAICRLLRSEAERREWQRRARAGIEKFCIDRMAREVTGVYAELIRKRSNAAQIGNFVGRRRSLPPGSTASQDPNSEEGCCL
jgi:glycosyltransferase involved in cell wall biosynthesis